MRESRQDDASPAGSSKVPSPPLERQISSGPQHQEGANAEPNDPGVEQTPTSPKVMQLNSIENQAHADSGMQPVAGGEQHPPASANKLPQSTGSSAGALQLRPNGQQDWSAADQIHPAPFAFATAGDPGNPSTVNEEGPKGRRNDHKTAGSDQWIPVWQLNTGPKPDAATCRRLAKQAC